MKNTLQKLLLSSFVILISSFAWAQTPAPSTPAPSSTPAPATPIPLVTPAPIATPIPRLNLTAKLPPATVQAALGSLAQFVTLPAGVTLQGRSVLITILIGKDGTAVVHVQ